MQPVNENDQNLRSDSLLVTQGQVIDLSGEFALVDVQRQTGCGGCASQSACGTSALASLFASTTAKPLRVPNRIQAKVGDLVELSLDESRLVKHAFMAYGWPLVALFVGALGLKYLAQTLLGVSETSADLFSIAGGGFGLISGWVVTRRVYRPVLPVLSRVVKTAESQSFCKDVSL
ncbi:SoxR reducing system RseC family protein [Thiomicrorhabdus sp. zzn3]|uniref:SoxR reducing system RseC family protein n=1 Tax=Thiomicrorhabdus sp. zzn3 TaxID=3039775 RepID=UPI002436E6FE|nr:SoxR reducing system RseC family protein [Thiomicrorhabdus sp. zzn3]MDG6777795.1 SoxR reducing system RseC family protein [Thiomicrorhabdus sp. zzn3]